MDKKLFMVSNKPLALWGTNLDRANRAYLDDVDGDFFTSVAETLYEEAKGRGRSAKRAKIALRFIYLNSLETLFALLSASIQAPDCVLGWLMKYRISDIRTVLQAINRNEYVYNKWELKTLNWESVFRALFPLSEKINHFDQIEIAFCKAWKMLSRDFLNDISRNEYNSIKHGLRCRFNPQVALTITNNGISTRFRGSRSGLSFPVVSEIEGFDKKFSHCNFTYSNVYKSWYPYKLLSRIRLISISINNIANVVKRINHQGKLKISFLSPEPLLLKAAFQRDRCQFNNLTTWLNTKAFHIAPLTASEINNVLCTKAKAHTPSKS